MRVFIQDRDVDQIDALERGLLLAGHEPVVIYSLTEILDMASHPDLVPDVVVAEASVVARTVRRLGESTAGVLRDLLAEGLLVATGPVEETLPMETCARLPRPVSLDALQELLSGPTLTGRDRRTARRVACAHGIEVHVYNGGSYGPFTARLVDLSMDGACVKMPGGAVPGLNQDATVDIWVHDGPLCATRLHGRLAWSCIAPESCSTRVGVEFSRLTEAARARIETALVG
ncbi:MAG: PilZ domain-containing protein [Pseudomonadota bacterium]